MKHLWMIVAIACLVAAVHRTLTLGLNESYLFFIFAVISILMYLLRNYMGKKEKH